jgi:hypothetical protein
MRRHALVTTAAALALAATTLHAPAQAKTKAPDTTTHVTFTRWDFGDGDPAGGTHDGTAVTGGALTMAAPTATRGYDDPFDTATVSRSYDESSWTSPTVDPTFGLTELVASWNAHTPDGTWVETSVQGVADDGTSSKWYVLGRWADDDANTPEFHPTSLGGQADSLATVSIDTLVALNGHTFDTYRIKVSLLRPAGSASAPSVDMVGAMASSVPEVKKRVAPPTTMTEDKVLDVPTYSQELHVGHYPQYDNGGEAWCSPTSTAMVLDYWGAGPTEADYAWVLADDPDHVDPWVDHAARHTFDYNYDGAGNWPFNTAYAGASGLEGFVTRLRDLTEAEAMIKAGIPVVTSVSFKKSELDGAGYGTNGHLMVIVGFTKDGDVVVNDPASHLIPDDDQVRVTYDRQQFSDAWIGHTGGIAYVIHPDDGGLPVAKAEANW